MKNNKLKILWFGNPFFVNSLKNNNDFITFSYNPNEFSIYKWDNLIEISGFIPDILVVSDKSTPPFLLDIEKYPCLTIFYSIDSHIHSWHPLYAQVFDACMVSLKDNIANFNKMLLSSDRIWWMPAFSHTYDVPDFSITKEYDAIFVGTDNAETMPKRHKFLSALKETIPNFLTTFGNYRQLYPKAKVVVNHAERGDLNFRIFEALGCGSALVTPRMGHGLEEMFEDGKHLLLYESDNARDAAEKIKYLLDNPVKANELARNGLLEVNRAHKDTNRAQTFLEHIRHLENIGIPKLVEERKNRYPNVLKKYLSILYLHFAGTISDDGIRSSFLAAAKANF